MNDFFHGARPLAFIALLASYLAVAEVPVSPLPEAALPTNSTPADPLPEAAATNIPAATPDNPTNTVTQATNSPSRSDREGSRSRRSDRRRDRSESTASEPASGASTNTPSIGTDFASFGVIPERNIFNMNRSSRSARSTREPPPKTIQIDTFALVGAMSYAKGDFAFFDGSNSDFRKVLKPGDSIGGFRLKSVGLNSVQLDAAGKSIELAIGSHFRREEQGEWRLVAENAPATASSSSSGRERSESDASDGASGQDETKTASTDSGGVASDILQRLMKKREQEMGK